MTPRPLQKRHQNIRLRTVLASALCLMGGGLLLPFGFRALLSLPDRLMLVLILGYLGGAALITVVVAITAWVSLWPATPYLDLAPGEVEPRGAEPREAKAAVLSYPARVATAATASGQLAVVAGWLALTVGGEPPGVVLGLSLTTAVFISLSWLLLYVLSQRAVQPLLLRLREVSLSPGELLAGITLRGRLCYALSTVVCAGVVPAAVFAGVYLDRAHMEAERAQASRTAGWLAEAVRGLEPRRAEQVIESSNLSYGFPSPWPEEASRAGLGQPPRGAAPTAVAGLGTGNDIGATAVSEPLRVALPQGKRLYLPPSPPAEPPLGLIITGGVFFVLVVGAGLLGGGLVARDVGALTAEVSKDTETQALHQALHRRESAPPLATIEARQVYLALLRLIDRMRRLHVESYLAIERTIDARRAKSQFLASMSHDLRSPLGSVLGFAELLSGGYEGQIPEEAQRRLVRIHQTGRRLLRLLSEILDTAKVESQTIELHPRRCSVAELIAQAVADARRGRLQDDVPVVLDLPPGQRPIYVDPMRFPQALGHLIGHVLDSTAAEPGVHRLRITVQDSSAPPPPPGYDPDGHDAHDADDTASAQAAVIQPMRIEVGVERVDNNGPEPTLALGTVGLGLALPLARRLIALHGGTIELPTQPRPSLVAVVPLRRGPGA